MSLSLRQVRYVVEVARLGSIQAASRELSISQSSILAAIDLAEADIGARMFMRRPSQGMRTTPAGERFIAAARGLLAAETEFVREIGSLADRPPRLIRIGCFLPFGPLFMPEVLRRLVARTGSIDISVMEADQLQLRDWLDTGHIDAAVTYEMGPPFAGEITRICKVPAHVLMRADDPLARLDAVPLAALAERPHILLDLPQTGAYLTSIVDMSGLGRRISFRTRSYDTVRAAVEAGFGLTILNLRPMTRVAADTPDLCRRPIADPLPPPNLIVIDPYGDRKPRFLTEFIAEMHAMFRELGPRRFAVAKPEEENELLPA
ncbi:DNA-binding transcriptional LysR family regulator [Azorhizobium sp. AG788]|uniref:LysR substrate-binding domain-containing protein n=1 Tax=Azorhizobium sp. AG788 TaxID=2183897 RepID=UPI001060049D|nr:LysR substrate-binding domain-containing protein [Azorhizobium sp. AG788]TDT99244.1 DNA-binding transcriptional LysR family regulator [Azorhizobium sp. AG788]